MSAQNPPEHDPAAYDYDLPAECIAKRPETPRDHARLLLLRRDGTPPEDHRVRDLPDVLRSGDLLVVNETKVIPARLYGTVTGRSRDQEFLLIREIAPRRWEAMTRGVQGMRPGDEIRFRGGALGESRATFVGRLGERVEVLFHDDAAGLMSSAGHMPIPHYIRRQDDEMDRVSYQTVFARVPGAVAAPTAGLHFTPALITHLAGAGIRVARVLLHVGPGTFRPIRSASLRDHRVEPEFYSIPEETACVLVQTREEGGRVIAVGTTTLRALETWTRSPEKSQGWTDLTVVPGFSFKIVDCLMTNFHLPRSSLLVLVSAFAGRERVLSAYAEAIRRGYRFYSYGDAMLIL